jgi:tyrosine decarboxylase / aspartate 1-decarboxylase
MMFDARTLPWLTEALETLQMGFDGYPDLRPSEDDPRIRSTLRMVAERLQDNYPYFHPLYAGQMLKPPHAIARLAYMLSLWINPNNHALDGGRASSAMEKEAVAQLAAMFGWSSHLGHLTGGGTMANLEALWVSGRLAEGKTIVASDQAHYTHRRISEVLRIPFEALPSDEVGRMKMDSLRRILDTGNVGTVVATIGSTGMGSVDPLPEILELQKKYAFRIHADAAYGGYFTLARNLRPDTRRSFENLSRVDSIAIDPHKHGLQPYGCGCILHRDPAVGTLYKHESPYTYFTSSELHLGEISLECSRPGASAVALWATQQLLPLAAGGEFALGLESSRQAALTLTDLLRRDRRCVVLLDPELDIVVWAPKGESASEISRRSRAVFNEAGKRHLHLAMIQFPASRIGLQWPGLRIDQDHVTFLRSCLMKPEHNEWIGAIWDILSASLDSVSSEG